MADQSDVENAFVAAISAALYPNGTDAAPATGTPCRVYRGWPNAAALDADLAAGRVNVTVFPVDGAIRNTTRWPTEWQATIQHPSLTASVSGARVTLTGDAAPGQLAGILADAKTYVHRTQPGDTPELVAAILAAAVRADRVAQLSGASITIPGVGRLIARTVADAPAAQEVRRQAQTFRISVWCPTPALRDAVTSYIDAQLAASRFLALADGSTGRHRFRSGSTFDQHQVASLYRRDLLYEVDYPTVLTATQPSMLFGDLGLAGADLYS